MALINCTKCGNEMSEKSKKCPSCGADNEIFLENRNIKDFLRFFLAIMIVAVGIYAYGKIKDMPPNVDKAVYALGVQALEITDSCMTNGMDYYEATTKLSYIRVELEGLKIKNKSIAIQSYVSFLEYDTNDLNNSSSDTSSTVMRNDRNALAKLLNKD